MKKLSLILICLFVSFEVKSESDDLSGKKLLCEGRYEGYQRTIGINFVNNIDLRIITVHYNDPLSDPYNEPWLSDFDGYYTTTLRKIKMIG